MAYYVQYDNLGIITATVMNFVDPSIFTNQLTFSSWAATDGFSVAGGHLVKTADIVDGGKES